MYTADPQQASNFVAGVDLAFMIILGVSVFFLIALTVIMLVFIRKYRKEKHPKAVQNEGNNKLEALWTGIPLVLVLVMFYFGWMGWKPMKNPPDDAMRVTAIARMWPVILDLVALDVLHSLYIPAFRVKEDMVPGQDKVMWFIPGTPGEFDLFCTEYCGLQHSYMFTAVKVVPKEEFDAWMTDTTAVTAVLDTELSLADQGWQVLTQNGCNVCHSSDGTKIIGPSYLGGWGGTRTVVSGREELQVTVDEAYIMRSIFDPGAEVVKGFIKGQMTTYEGMVTEAEVKLIIEYLKALNE